MTSDTFNQIVLYPIEAEGMIDSLKTFEMREIGTAEWYRQQEIIDKLNMQALLSAANQSDEFIKEFLVTYQKLPALISLLISVELWKERVFSELPADYEPPATFPIYSLLYHEATLATLLETVIYHEDAAKELGNLAIDLLDFCGRKLALLVQLETESIADLVEFRNGTRAAAAEAATMNGLQELREQNKCLSFEIALKSISIISYLVEHAEHHLPLGCMTRLLNGLDLPMILQRLLTHPPWIVTVDKTDKTYRYEENRWEEIDSSVPPGARQISKLEGQIWVMLCRLLLKNSSQQMYQMTPMRTSNLLKIRSLLTEPLLDQLTPLIDLRRYLEELSIIENQSSTSNNGFLNNANLSNRLPAPLILEQVPAIRDDLEKSNKKQWKKIRDNFIQEVYRLSQSGEFNRQAKVWAENYSMDTIESLLTEKPKCANCGESAAKRCSRCKQEWYCGRECQVNHWKKHKTACDLMKNLK